MVNNSYEHYRRGVNCYWNSMSLLLEQHGLEHMILKHLSFGYIYSNSKLDITFELEAESSNSLGWLDQYINIKRYRLSEEELYEFLKQNKDPFLLCVNIKALASEYRSFPNIHDYHYLNVVGIEDKSVRVKDQYFGYRGLIPINLILKAIQPDTIVQIGEVIQLEVNYDYLKEKSKDIINLIRNELLMRFDQYLEGTFKFDGVLNYVGKKALEKLSEELDTVIFSAIERTESIQDNWNYLLRRFNTSFIYSREGMIFYLTKYKNLFPFDISILVNCMEESLAITRHMSFLIIQANLKKKGPEDLIRSFKQKLEEVIKIEEKIYEQINLLRSELDKIAI